MTDFDQTLTKARFHDGTLCDNSFKVMFEYPSSPSDMKNKSRESYAKYYPIYKDLTLPREERLKHMNDWWDSDMTRFAQAGLSRADYIKMAVQGKLLFRNGTKGLFEECHKQGLDFFVVSAGITDYLESCL